MELELKGKTALITGGTRGIGRAIAFKLAEQGVSLALNYFRNGPEARQTAMDIQARFGHEPLLLKANVGEPDKIQEMFHIFHEHHSDGLDILISNAASGVLKPALELTPRHLQWTMEINAHALLFLTQQAVPGMKKRGGGKIVAISSLGATRALPYYTAVGASKAALESMVRHLSMELASSQINVNAVSAGVVDTAALNHFPNREVLLRESLNQTPAIRAVIPDDVANAVVFLCSQMADMIHGQTIVVDGGCSILAVGKGASG